MNMLFRELITNYLKVFRALKFRIFQRNPKPASNDCQERTATLKMITL